MAKGDICPKCGSQKFQHVKTPKAEGAMRCTDCGARGWLGHPDPMLGRGKKCLNCEQNQVRVTATASGGELQYCYSCGALAV